MKPEQAMLLYDGVLAMRDRIMLRVAAPGQYELLLFKDNKYGNHDVTVLKSFTSKKTAMCCWRLHYA
jgi:hypothetical protein